MNSSIGSELHLFEQATNWKSYYRQFLRDYLRGDVLEVGAGIGATTQTVCDGSQRRWVCLEPDATLCESIQAKVSAGTLPACCEVIAGQSADLNLEWQFDAILYVDVLEHIEKDRAEIITTQSYLKPHGHLLILSPAHQWLYTPFDQQIGHYRRYNKRTLLAAIPDGLQLVSLRYLDSVGMLASAGNRFVLKSPMPSNRQLQFWDKTMIPLSRMLDPLLGYRVGKTLLGIWRKK